MTDEEKEALRNFKTEYKKLIKEDNILFPLYKSDAKRLINLIEKQSKEIEELKETLKCTQNSWYEDTKVIEKQFKEIEELKKYEKYYEEMEEVNKRFIAVDKIKAKIEDILNSENSEAIEKLIEWQAHLEKRWKE